MKKNLTELVFILDKSGSMYNLKNDTIGGFNSMLDVQKKEEGECLITTVLFDSRCELLHDRIDIHAVKPITEKEYAPGGCTALIDAIGMGIHKIMKAQANTAEDYRAENVMFVIITDGQENSSKEYSLKTVKRMIEEQKKHGWEFLFLGANIDAIATAGSFGIHADRAVNYVPDQEGTRLNYRVASEAARGIRANGHVDDDCLDAIRADMAKRGRKKS